MGIKNKDLLLSQNFSFLGFSTLKNQKDFPYFLLWQEKSIWVSSNEVLAEVPWGDETWAGRTLPKG